MREIKYWILIDNMKNLSGRTLYGADVLTIINKAIDNNEFNNVKKTDDGLYIDNDDTSIKVTIILLKTNDKEEITEVVYDMEKLEKAGLDKFVSSFGITNFECANLEYHSNGRISKITVKQIEI